MRQRIHGDRVDDLADVTATDVCRRRAASRFSPASALPPKVTLVVVAVVASVAAKLPTVNAVAGAVTMTTCAPSEVATWSPAVAVDRAARPAATSAAVSALAAAV